MAVFSNDGGWYSGSLPPSLLSVFVVPSGRLAATGSGDSSIKILDVDRMVSKTALGHQQDLHPVIRTLYDHTDVCCDIAVS